MTRGTAAFVVGASLVVAALAGLSWMLLDLDGRECAAREAASAERAVGEALLRMDIVMMPILAGESARWPAALQGMPVQLPPPSDLPFVRRYFAIVPGADAGQGLLAEALRSARETTGEDGAPLVGPSPLPTELRQRSAGEPAAEEGVPAVPTQTADTQSFQGRAQLQNNFALGKVWANGLAPSGLPEPFRATFVAGETAAASPVLYLSRRVGPGDDRVQCVEIDWPVLSQWLLGQTKDVLPNARLRPCVVGETARRLASLPVAIEPGPLHAAGLGSRSVTMRVVVGGVWLVVLGALAAAGLALRAANSLAARRAMFVSSVTHELRTPLTTFRMYADMLASGMVPEAARADYYATLRTESERLTRIVESVLLYARLEDGRDSAHRRTVPVAELCVRIEPLLRQRCADGGRELTFAPAELGDAAVHVDPQAVEQILHNLVDNACKYAPTGPIGFAVRARGDRVEFEVRDTGPGIPAADAAALFQPFQRGASHRGGSTPGLGLGLSIARGLAEAMGGELQLASTGPSGTTFWLVLPVVLA